MGWQDHLPMHRAFICHVCKPGLSQALTALEGSLVLWSLSFPPSLCVCNVHSEQEIPGKTKKHTHKQKTTLEFRKLVLLLSSSVILSLEFWHNTMSNLIRLLHN